MITVILPSTPERVDRRRECLLSLTMNAGMPFNLHMYISEKEGWVKSVHKALRGIEGLCVIIGDDMVFGKDWLKILYESYMKQFPEMDGLAQPYDEIHRGKLAVCPCAPAHLLREMIYKGYKHNFSDTELTVRMQSKNKYLYVPESIVEHKHYLLGKSKKDNTYSFSQKFYERDKKIYEKRNPNHNV